MLPESIAEYFSGANVDENLINHEESQSEVVIVSCFGTTSIHEKGYKSYPMEQMLGKNILNRNNLNKVNEEIEGFFDVENKIIYLHLRGISDSSTLLQAMTDLNKVLMEKGFLSVWSELKVQYARSLLLLFSLSHILLYYHPNHIFDTTCIHLFKSLDIVREKVGPQLSLILEDIPGVSNTWCTNRRLCSPRVLFIFSSRLIPSSITKKHENNAKGDGLKKSPYQSMEFDLEYKIYNLLRKSRVITNISANSLFALPSNEPFVYMLSKDEVESPATVALTAACGHKSWHGSEGAVWRSHSTATIDVNATSNVRHSALSDSSKANELSETIMSSFMFDSKRNVGHSFSVFLQQHIDEAFQKHFDDNVGRHAGPSFFEVPTAQVWFKAYKKLYQYILPNDDPDAEILYHMKNHVDIDTRFSSVRCSKILPLATAVYKEGLPSHYSLAEHRAKLNSAIELLSNQSRGPSYDQHLATLEEICEQYWKDGRIGCEHLSLTGNPCHLAKHESPDASQNHNSGVNHSSYCNCGYTRVTLPDPYHVKDINFDFANSVNSLCCSRLNQYDFPTFRSSDTAENLATSKSFRHCTPDLSDAIAWSKIQDSPVLTSDSAGNHEVKTLSNLVDLTTQKSEIVVNVIDEESTGHDGFSRTVSTTEYLPGMLTVASPSGILPVYTSWALLCLGASSLYSHNSGINDQPGFVQGTNFLLPWDVTVKIKDKEKWPLIAESMGKKGFMLKNKKNRLGGDLSEFNVKIFLGCEYQCLRGHRFMMSSPDKYLKATSGGHVKETAAKIANSDMPLYFPCQCSRLGNLKYAQLTRIHIVTPKAPVNVTLSPVVSFGESPSCQFVPQHVSGSSIKLSASAYWVLRLPFAYEGENGPYYHPDSNPTVPPLGKLVKGCYGISEITLDI